MNTNKKHLAKLIANVKATKSKLEKAENALPPIPKKDLHDLREAKECAERELHDFSTMTTTSQIKKDCQRYLGNRGINEEIKRCAYYDGLWFIVFASAPEDVEVSKESSCYECWDIIPSKDFAWSLSSYKAIKHGL